MLIRDMPLLARQFVAERQGFEPWVPLQVQRISNPSRSSTPAPLHTIEIRLSMTFLIVEQILRPQESIKFYFNSCARTTFQLTRSSEWGYSASADE